MTIRPQQKARDAELAALADESLPSERRGRSRRAWTPHRSCRRESSSSAARLPSCAKRQRASRPRPGCARESSLSDADRAPLRLRLVLSGGLMAAAAAALVIALVVPGGAGGPSIARRGESRRPATEAAPLSQPGRPTLLAKSVEGVAFPSWEARVRLAGSEVPS